MTVKELLKFSKGDTMYQVVDATKPGYMVHKYYLIEADRNVINRLYSDCTVIGFEPNGNNKLRLYIEP